MPGRRVLVTGATGVGSTTLGRALAVAWAVPHADVDDYLWLPTSPPYTDKRPVAERVPLMRSLFVPRPAWVLSGTLRGWGDEVIADVDAVVFLTAETDVRLERLRRRDVVRYGTAVAAGGSLAAAHHDFLSWAGDYDDTDVPGRRSADEAWLAGLHRPVLRLSGERPLDDLRADVLAWLGDVDPR
ncbi:MULTISPECIES: hypothetical protein [unclassified Saccharopolyspora]|uniref:hypothetical protein n=1 Tax=unclassified Saccharopolyspora TaxID=2646250 RepID=UPI001CD5E67C|nr:MULTISPECIES: hypothetical protein [unclassified Saccharopolyspora]MCA1185024.1 hypothetical protein [Saccharopolyspora sp. 6T]MCA1190746.1 hypothetical protein [Saccharopolyspora sp. 6V]MCA1226243.1 hypothetical protein [Saccharopolyspora sp. 6M]MCA1278210.1 hypothetical protein [Saccharopolyspora sp. 7B]